MKENQELIRQLDKEHQLQHHEWVQLISGYTEEDINYAADLAQKIAVQHFGKNIYFRGIIEFTNICKNDCLYCGIRHSNSCVERYRLTNEQIFSCCDDGYEHGFRTFVLQGGEDDYYTDEVLADIVQQIHHRFPDCAITLSVGERSRESYQKLFDAGARRYLLRHETIVPDLYKKWHPKKQRIENRIRCLNDLKEIGYQAGCGFMVGAPWQTAEDLAYDMEFITNYHPEMIGIGPFIPHKDTPFKDFPAGDTRLTLLMLSLCRILQPEVLLPATTALGTVQNDGRQLGVLGGCNVVMPNLSPMNVREKYLLYNNKAGTKQDAEAGVRILREQMAGIDYQVLCTRGDYKEENEGRNLR